MVQSANITVMSDAARKASRGLLRDFGELDKLQVSKKGVANFVTNADIRTEKILREELEKARKNYGFLMEESGSVETESDFRWVIDPLDGTSNFIHAIPYFCISIALEKRNADGAFEPIAAIIYDPIHDELFAAEKDKGATCNGYRLKVSRREQDVLFSTAAPVKWKDNYDEANKMLERVTSNGAQVRCSGAAALDLAYVAAGRYDAIWYHHLQPWDIAAGMLLVREAGGIVTEFSGQTKMTDAGSLIASNGVIHSSLHNWLIPEAA